MTAIGKYMVLGIGVLLCSCRPTPEVTISTHPCASMPSPRASACACTLEGKAYVFGGRDQSGNYLNDLWQYDPASDQWTLIGTAPFNKRVNATMIGTNGTLYIGLGYSALHAYRDTAYQRDWWEYTISTNQWNRLSDYPIINTVAATPFVEGDKIYVLYGSGPGFGNEIGEYTISSDQWLIHTGKSYRAKYCFGACGAMINGMVYFGTGYNTHNLTQWYAADLSADRWTARSSIPGKGRQWCACTADNNYIYLLGGRYFGGDMTGGEVFNTYMRYSPTKDQWEWCGTMPCGRAENQIAFTIDNVPYFGLGEDENGKIIDQLYYIDQ